jgi:hypothetical protein
VNWIIAKTSRILCWNWKTQRNSREISTGIQLCDFPFQFCRCFYTPARLWPHPSDSRSSFVDACALPCGPGRLLAIPIRDLSMFWRSRAALAESQRVLCGHGRPPFEFCRCFCFPARPWPTPSDSRAALAASQQLSLYF